MFLHPPPTQHIHFSLLENNYIHKQLSLRGSLCGSMQVPGMCIVVIVVVVIRVVVVSSSTGKEDMVFLDPVWLAAEERKAVVSSPGDMTVAVDSACPSPGTACVGLVVVPAQCHFIMTSHPHSTVTLFSKPLRYMFVYLYQQRSLLSIPYFAGQHGSSHPEDKNLW